MVKYQENDVTSPPLFLILNVKIDIRNSTNVVYPTIYESRR